MGQYQHLKHTAKEEESEGEAEKEKRPSPQQIEKPRKSSESSEEDKEFKVGIQLQDDVINSFCDKLQAVCPKRIEGLLAIQYLMISDADEIKKHVSGKRMALQVLYDVTRRHYVLLHYDPKYEQVVLYDSLQPYDANGKPEVIDEIGKQISHLFGHLTHRYIPLLIDKEYEHQNDNFSCGYRCIGALVDLARERKPAKYTYSRTAIMEFIKFIIHEPNPTWQMFERVRFSREKEYSGEHRIRMHMRNRNKNRVRNSSSSSTATSVSSRSSSTASSTGKRAAAGRVVFSDTDFEHLRQRLQSLKLEMSSDSEEDPPAVSRIPPPEVPPEAQNPRPRPRQIPLPPVSPNDPNVSPYVSLRDFVLAVYHTPLNWKTIFRVKKEEVPADENV